MIYNPNIQQYSYANGGRLYNQRLPQYSFGSFLRSNAGTIGSVVGAGIGTIIAPGIGTSIGASLGGQVGGAVQSDYEGDLAYDAQMQQMNQQKMMQAQANQINMANQRLQNNSLQSSNNAGTNRFAYGGRLSGIDPEALFALHLNDSSTGRRGIYRGLTPESQSLIRKNEGFDNNQKSTVQTIYRGNQHNFYGTGSNGEINYLSATQPFTGTEMNEYQQHLDALKQRDNRMNNFQLPFNPQTPELKQKALGGQLQEYTGQTHQGKDGGIKVDAMGNPTSVSGNQAVGLVEDKENSWLDPSTKQTYIFSDKLFYNKDIKSRK